MLDYGPFAFLSTYEPGYVSASFDTEGQYAFGRQVEACRWNLHRLGLAFSLLPSVFRTPTATIRGSGVASDGRTDQAIPSLEEVLVRFHSIDGPTVFSAVCNQLINDTTHKRLTKVVQHAI